MLNETESKNLNDCNHQNNSQEAAFNTNYDDTKVINVNTLIKKKKKPVTESQEKITEVSKDSVITLSLKEDCFILYCLVLLARTQLILWNGPMLKVSPSLIK